MKLILLLMLLMPPAIHPQEQNKPEPERLHCKVISIERDERGVDVVTLGDCVNQDGDPLFLKRLRAPAGLNLDKKNLNPEVSNVVLERTLDKLCIVQINVMGGWVKEAVNQKHECVELQKKSARQKKRRNGETQ